jgi:hypothetical protein
MTRPVSTPILSATGAPREGLRVDFHAEPPNESVFAITDAGGVFVAELEPGIPYMVSSENPFSVDGQEFSAGTVFRVIVPEGEGPVTIPEVTVEIIDASRPALLAMIADLTARIAALEAPVTP